MSPATNLAARERQILSEVFDGAAVIGILAALVHATVKIVPLLVPLLNLTVNVSPSFSVNADP